MPWSNVLIVIAVEMAFGFLISRALIPCFRKLKTGKFDFYIGDRFAKDGSEPRFGGVIISVAFFVGIVMSIGSLRIDSADYNESIGKTASIVVFGLLMMILGLFEDWNKDVKKNNLNIKASVKLFFEFALCFAFLLSLNAFSGAENTAVLLPFRLGYMDFKFLYYPLMALGMTLTVNAVKMHDCFGSDTNNGIDGLCAATSAVFSLIMAVCGSITDKWELNVLGYVMAAAVMSFLVWGLSPAKIYLGESGALFLGGIISAMTVASGLHLIVLMAGIAFIADSVCTIIQYAVYKKSRKLVFKGVSLHAHWKEKGFNDYKIIFIFTVITVIGGVAGVAFSLYSTKL